MKEKILRAVATAPLENVLDIKDFEHLDWIWVNREIFIDICRNLKLDEQMQEDQLEEALQQIEEQQMFEALEKPFAQKGYVRMDQFQFAQLETGYKPTEDIETIIFVRREYYKRLSIRLQLEYEWILKAMAVDSYLRMGLEYKSLREVYEDLYESNSRILEDILAKGEYQYSTGTWKYIRKTGEVYFYKQKKFYNSWAEGEVRSKFEELMDRE